MTNTDDDDLQTVARFRSPLMAVAGGVLGLAAAVTLWVTADSWRYYLRSGEPVDHGNVEEALAKGKLRHNTYVELTGRPLLASEGNAEVAITAPGCLTGPTKRVHYALLAETGDRVVVRTRRSLKLQRIARRTAFTGRLLRIDTTEPPHRLYRRFVYKLTDCKNHPKTCDKFLLQSADIATEALLKHVGKRQAVLRGIKGESIQVKPMTPLYLALRFPGDYEYTVRNADKDAAVKKVQALGVPYVWVERSGRDQDFVIRPPRAVAERLIKGQRRGSGYSISERTAGYHVRFGWLKRRGDNLVITKATRGFPTRYRVQPAAGGQPARLVAIPVAGSPRVRVDAIRKAAYHGPRRLPQRAWLLLEGVKPSHARWGGIVALAMLLTLLGGLFLVLGGLRRPRR